MYFQSVCKLVSNLHAKYWQLWQSACDQSNYMEVFSAALHTSLVPLTHLLQACVTQALVSVTSRLLVFHIKIKFFKLFLCVLVSMWLGYIWTSIKNNDSKMCLWFFFSTNPWFSHLKMSACCLFDLCRRPRAKSDAVRTDCARASKANRTLALCSICTSWCLD